jgi:Glycosyltransferase family 87
MSVHFRAAEQAMNFEILRNGDWLTRERIRLVAVALIIASTLGLLYLVVTAHGDVDRQGRPLGTDFSDVYAAGTYVNEGQPAAPFDLARQYAREQAMFGAATPFYGWHYPPYFLFVAAALAKMPYGLALAVWQAVTLALYLMAIRAILEQVPLRLNRTSPSVLFRSEWLLLALAYPAVLVNIGHGQNGFLTAALLGGALAVLDRRPLLAGVLIGLLVYKPQFGLMIPIALAAGGRWRCFTAAAITVVILTLATTLAFGPQVWTAFLASTHFTRTVALEQGNTGWHKIQSVFAWARMWGAPIALAYVLQGLVSVALAGALIWLWRSAAPYALKAAALCLAAILATPYSFDYDMMASAPAIAYLSADGLKRGFGPWEKTALAALWLVPLVARTIAHLSLVPLGVPAMLATFVAVLRRAQLDLTARAAFPGTSAAIAPAAGGKSRGHDIAAFKS